MLLAVLTDLHANEQALAACMAHARQCKVEQYVFLGDLVGYGADPESVLDTVIDYAGRGAHVVLGNHDIAMLQDDAHDMNPLARHMIEWTRTRLSASHIAFIGALPLHIALHDVLLVHANAWAPARWEYIDGVMEAARSMHASMAQVTFCGHVHTPALYHMTLAGKTGQFQPAPGQAIPLSRLRQWLVIPGAVGQPRDGDPAACYATFDTVTRELNYFRVPYDAAAAAARIIDAGLPPGLAQRLLTGN